MKKSSGVTFDFEEERKGIKMFENQENNNTQNTTVNTETNTSTTTGTTTGATGAATGATGTTGTANTSSSQGAFSSGSNSDTVYTYGNYGSYTYSNMGGSDNQGMTGNGPVPEGPAPTPGKPPKKKGKAGKIVAGVVVAAVLVCGAGVGYKYMEKNDLLPKVVTDSEEDQMKVADAEDQKDVQNDEKNSGNSEKSFGADEAQENGADDQNSKDADSSSAKDGKVSTTSAVTPTTVVTDVSEVVKSAMPSIVAIDNSQLQTVQYMFGGYGQKEATSMGSGIIVGQNDDELLVATNAHVIDGADSLKVQFIDGTKVEAAVKGADETRDVAVIAVQLADMSQDTLDQIAIAVLGDSDALQPGEPAIAIGNALGWGQSVTAGVVSAVNREIAYSEDQNLKFIQTDAAINPGNSGGALLNARGEVIGINSNKIGMTTVEGMCYAIPISEAKPIIDKLMNERTQLTLAEDEQGYLGVRVATPVGVDGAYITDVFDGSAAQKGGMEIGDIVMQVNDTDITSREDLTKNLSTYKAGEEIHVLVLRKGDQGYGQKELTITLQSKDEMNQQSEAADAQSQNGYAPSNGYDPNAGWGQDEGDLQGQDEDAGRNGDSVENDSDDEYDSQNGSQNGDAQTIEEIFGFNPFEMFGF